MNSKVQDSIAKISTGNKALWLAYDQGMEHGTIDFDERNIDPNFVLDISLSGYYNAVIVGRGIAEYYYQDAKYKGKIPLIVKVNGHTRFNRDNPISPQICSVDEAIALGAVAVGYTVYVGSPSEHLMIREFAALVKEAHEKGIAVIGWMYPRGRDVGELTPEIIAYGARVGMEIGADFVKVTHPGTLKTLEWVVKAAGRARVMIAGGDHQKEPDFEKKIEMINKSGAYGMAVGRNIWEAKDPIAESKIVHQLIFGK